MGAQTGPSVGGLFEGLSGVGAIEKFLRYLENGIAEGVPGGCIRIERPRGFFELSNLLTHGIYQGPSIPRRQDIHPDAPSLAMLLAPAPVDLVRSGYEEAVREGYLWHEFGDSHLILPRAA